MAVTKTSIMLGCGEQPQEVLDTMQELRDAGKQASFPRDLPTALQQTRIHPATEAEVEDTCHNSKLGLLSCELQAERRLASYKFFHLQI